MQEEWDMEEEDEEEEEQVEVEGRKEWEVEEKKKRERVKNEIMLEIKKRQVRTCNCSVCIQYIFEVQILSSELGVIGDLISPVHSLMLNYSLSVYHVKLDWLHLYSLD